MATHLLLFFFFIISSLSFLQMVKGQGRAPHGLAYENPIALSPSAFEFFHPKSTSTRKVDSRCEESNCAPLPLSSSYSSAVAESTLARESKFSNSPHSGESGIGIGTGGVVGIVFASAFVVVIAMGAYYVMITRRTNTTRAISVQCQKPDLVVA